jgi:hypothetical protein
MNRFLLLIASVALFTLCLLQPAVEFEKVCKNHATGLVEVAGLGNEPLGPLEIMGGLKLLLIGGFGILIAHIGAVGWLANPLYFAALITTFSTYNSFRKFSRWCAFGAFGLALISLKVTNWFPIPADEGTVCYFSAIQPKEGHWLWISAIMLMNAHVWVGAYNKPLEPTR